MKTAKKVKRITLRVDEGTYKRWATAAKSDERTLGVWIQRRIEGRPTTEPTPEVTSEEAPVVTPKKSIWSTEA